MPSTSILRRLSLFIAAAALTATLHAQAPPAEEADLLITNGHVIDGTGSPWMQENVAIKGDTIIYVGRAPIRAKRTIDAHGLTVTPGFFDMHAHSEFGFALDGRALSKITQGVTTEVLGEHLSAGPVLGPAKDDPMMIAPPVTRSWTTLGGFFSYLEKKGIGMNVVSYVGAGQVRASAMGYEDRTPTPAEMQRMKDLIAQAMQEGAFGLSAGLVYVPNSFDTTAEMIELAKVAASYGGIYTVHMRAGASGTANQATSTLSGLQETFAIAKGAHIPVEIFHFQGAIAGNPDVVKQVEAARADGIDVTANGYPYTAGWTYVRQLIPAWAQAGDSAAIVSRLKDPATRARVVAEIKLDPRPLGQYIIASSNLDFDGLTLQQIADKRHTDVANAMVDFLIIQNAEGFHITLPNPRLELGVANAFKTPWLDVCSDGIALPAGVHTNFGHPHPRSFGAHARILAWVVRDLHVLTLEEAIRHMTSQPADRLGVHDRGILRQGMKADIVIFDPATVQDTSTYEHPDQYATGIHYVFVNGTAVVANSTPTNALPGKVLKGPGYVPGTP